MRFWRDYRLAEDLRDGIVTEKQQMFYMLASTLFLCALISRAFQSVMHVDMPPLNFYDYSIDIISIVFIAFIIVVAFRINARGDGKDFVARYTCISFPILIKMVIMGLILGFISAFIDFFMQAGPEVIDLFSETSSLDQKLSEGLIRQEEYDQTFNNAFRTGVAQTTAIVLLYIYMLWRNVVCFKIAAEVR